MKQQLPDYEEPGIARRRQLEGAQRAIGLVEGMPVSPRPDSGAQLIAMGVSRRTRLIHGAS
jgi:hypothetical protein